jgi:hypothetical protein
MGRILLITGSLLGVTGGIASACQQPWQGTAWTAIRQTIIIESCVFSGQRVSVVVVGLYVEQPMGYVAGRGT